MSDTPRTDLELANWDESPEVKAIIKVARELERELTAANEQIRRLKEQIRVADGAFNHLNERHKLLYDFANRFLNPDDLGFAVNAHLRDDARESLGGKRVETR